MEFLKNQSTVRIIFIAFIIIAFAFRYAIILLVRNNRAKHENSKYQLLSMKFIAIHENTEAPGNEPFMEIELHGEKQGNNESIKIYHPIPRRVWSNQENKHQAILDQYGLEENPIIDVRIETNDPTKYVIVDNRF